MRIAICDTLVPFVHGGGERLRERLSAELRAAGHEVHPVLLPFRWYPPLEVAAHAATWRMVDLGAQPVAIDRAITLRFPAFIVQHPDKVAWVLSQHRTAYDLWDSEHGDLRDRPHGDAVRRLIQGLDDRHLAEHRRIHVISRIVHDRLLRFNGLESHVLTPPVDDAAEFRTGTTGDFVLYPARMDRLKRHELLIRAMEQVDPGIRCVMTGTGPERETITALIEELGLAARIEVTGHIPRDELLDLYASALCVYNGPIDEDYGYVTVEAMLSAKPVITLTDSGGPALRVTDGRTGFVVEPDARSIAAAIDRLGASPTETARMGAAGLAAIDPTDLDWGHVVTELTR